MIIIQVTVAGREAILELFGSIKTPMIEIFDERCDVISVVVTTTTTTAIVVAGL